MLSEVLIQPAAAELAALFVKYGVVYATASYRLPEILIRATRYPASRSRADAITMPPKL
jgi:hypothetical protein